MIMEHNGGTYCWSNAAPARIERIWSGDAAPQLHPPDGTQHAHSLLDELKLQAQPFVVCVQRSTWPGTRRERVRKREVQGVSASL